MTTRSTGGPGSQVRPMVMDARAAVRRPRRTPARHRPARGARRRAPRPAPADLRGRRHRCAPRGRRRRAHAARGACRRRAGHRARRHRLLRAVPGRRVDVRAASCPGRVEVRRGRAPTSSWRGSRCCGAAIDGRAVYEPGVDRVPRPRRRRPRPAPVLPRRRRPREDIGHFLAEAGYLHLEGVFTEAEMAAVSRGARRGDGRGDAGRRRVVVGSHRGRLVSVAHPRLQPQVADAARAARVGPLHAHRHVHRRRDGAARPRRTGDSAEGLLKKIGVLEGISDVSWHKDCSLGGHSRGCCGLTVGISVTGAQRRNGELGVVAGSQPRQRPAARRATRSRPAARPAADPHRRRHRALQLHAAHEPAADRPGATRRLHRLRPRAATRRRARGARSATRSVGAGRRSATRCRTSSVNRSSAPRRSSSISDAHRWCAKLSDPKILNMTGSDADVQALLGRSHRLGADKRVTNFAGGNTSAKLDPRRPGHRGADPGAGGEGLRRRSRHADRRRPRLRSTSTGSGRSSAVHAGGVHEDDIVALLRRMPLRRPVARCRRSTRRCTRFVDADHVDHLHPDSVIALAAAADGERLVAECYGDDVGWLDWRRPGFELGLALPRLRSGASRRARGRARRARA